MVCHVTPFLFEEFTRLMLILDDNVLGWFYKLALLDFELIFEVKKQEGEGV